MLPTGYVRSNYLLTAVAVVAWKAILHSLALFATFFFWFLLLFVDTVPWAGDDDLYMIAFLVFLPSGGTFNFLAKTRGKMKTMEGKFLRELLYMLPCWSRCRQQLDEKGETNHKDSRTRRMSDDSEASGDTVWVHDSSEYSTDGKFEKRSVFISLGRTKRNLDPANFGVEVENVHAIEYVKEGMNYDDFEDVSHVLDEIEDVSHVLD